SPQDKAAIVRNLRAAVRLLDAATEGAPPNGKMKDQRGASASKNQQEAHSAAVAAAAAAAAESRHYFTLKAILDRSPERFPPPAGTAMMADEALLRKVDVASCHAAALAILSSLEGSGMLSPPFPPPSPQSLPPPSSHAANGKADKRPRVSSSGKEKTATGVGDGSTVAGDGAAGDEGGDDWPSSPAAKRPKVCDEGGSSRGESDDTTAKPDDNTNAAGAGETPPVGAVTAAAGGMDEEEDDDDEEEDDDDDDDDDEDDEWMSRGLRKGAPEVLQR
ncbi:unnamed protein product, partial [Ectocarpus sp. 12 AP-2014]